MITKNISKVIQEKLKSKEIALSRKAKSANQPNANLELNFSDMASRTVFVRMVSDRKDYEVIEGGERSFADERKKLGFGDVYGKKSNEQIRGVSGIKNISVEYKGGFKGIRQATVTWLANSLDDLDRFESHFLTIGKHVLLEWGWVYKDRKKNIKEFFYKGMERGESPVDSSVFSEAKELILRNEGDYDAVGGVISNFETRLNEDGGFECTTTITSMGLDYLPGNEIKKETFDSFILSKSDGSVGNSKDNLLNCIINLHDVIVEEYFEQKNTESFYAKLPDRKELSLNTYRGVQPLDWYVRLINAVHWFDPLIPKNFEIIQEQDGGDVLSQSKEGFLILHKKNEGNKKVDVVFLNLRDKGPNKDEIIKTSDLFVRWGWFEDNIISRYTAFERNKDDEATYGTFRSIRREIDPVTLQSTSKKVNVKITNSPFLIPKDPLKFYLPSDNNVYTGKVTVVEGSNNYTEDALDELNKISAASGSFPTTNSKYGELRNVMINVKEIQKAFGIKPGHVTTRMSIQSGAAVQPPETLTGAMTNLISQFNENFYNYWDLIIQEDSDDYHVKIVEKTASDTFDKKTYTQFEGDSVDGANSLTSPSNKVQNIGVYRFPSFKLSSLVKSQELSFKIPTAQSYMAMFMSNLNRGEASGSTSVDGGRNNEESGLKALLASDSPVSEENKSTVLYTKVEENSGHKVGNSNEETLPQNDIKIDGSFEINVSRASNFYWRSLSSKDSSDENKKVEETKEFAGPSTEGFIDAKINSKDFKGYGDLSVPLYNVIKSNSDDDYDANTLKISVNSRIQGSINRRLKRITKDNVSQYKDYIIPAELSIDVDGTGGIFPAEIMHVDYISKRYRENLVVSGSDPLNPDNIVGPRTFFQIGNVTQTVDENGWTTSLRTIMRFNSDAFNAMSLPELPEAPEEPLVIITDEEYARIQNKTGEYADRRSELKRQMREAKRESLFEGNQNILDALDAFQIQPDPEYTEKPAADIKILGLVNYKNELIKRNRRIRERDEEINKRVEEEENNTKKLVETFIEVDDEDQNEGEDTEKQIEIKMERKVPVVKKKKEIKLQSFEELMKEISAGLEKVEQNNKQIAAKLVKKQNQNKQISLSPVRAEVTDLKSTYTGTPAQNRVLYRIREDWRPLYLLDDEGNKTGDKVDNNGNKLDAFRSGVSFKYVRKPFFDLYIEQPNKSGETSIIDSSTYIVDETKIPADLIRKERNVWWRDKNPDDRLNIGDAVPPTD